MSALGIEGSQAREAGVQNKVLVDAACLSQLSALQHSIEAAQAIGPECDPKLAVASILITGCAASLFLSARCLNYILVTKMHWGFFGQRLAGSVPGLLPLVLPECL